MELGEGLGDWRGTRGGAECDQSGMVVGREPVGEGEGEEELGGSDDESSRHCSVLRLEGAVVVEEEGSMGVGVGVVAEDSRLVGRGMLVDSHIRTS